MECMQVCLRRYSEHPDSEHVYIFGGIGKLTEKYVEDNPHKKLEERWAKGEDDRMQLQYREASVDFMGSLGHGPKLRKDVGPSHWKQALPG